MKKAKEHDIEYGRHSKIPECCIKFYITKWLKMSPTVRLAYIKKANFGYVPCPSCLKKNRKVRLHYCSFNNLKCKKYIRKRVGNLRWVRGNLWEVL